MAHTPPAHDPRPRHSAIDDLSSDAHDQLGDAAYRGHRVVDDNHRPIGKVTDVIYDELGIAKWAVVSPGVFRAEHFLPLGRTYLSLDGHIVVPFDRRIVSRSPKAERDHVLSPIIEQALEQYYNLAA